MKSSYQIPGASRERRIYLFDLRNIHHVADSFKELVLDFFASRNKLARKLAISERALADLERWRDGLRNGLKAVPYTDPDVGHGLQTVPNR